MHHEKDSFTKFFGYMHGRSIQKHEQTKQIEKYVHVRISCNFD